MDTCSNYIDLPLGKGVNAHWHPTNRYKTLRFDLMLRHQLLRCDNTRVALIGRLCERGTSSMPDMRSLNCYIDDLYGAYFSAEVGRIGDQQLIHLCIEVLDERFVDPGTHGDVLRRAGDFMRQVIADPLRDGQGYKRSYFDQEKRSLILQAESLYNDKIAYSQWRCAEEMGRGTAWGLSHWGSLDDLEGIGTDDLWRFHQQLLAQNPIDIFISGHIERDLATAMCEQVLAWPRRPIPSLDPPVALMGKSKARELFEMQDIVQSKLILGYDTGIGMRSEEYAAQILFNMTWGSDAQSQLFRRLREGLGLCYYIDSHIDSLAGIIYTSAGIEAGDYSHVLNEIELELENIQKGGVALGDLLNAKKLLTSRLVAMADDREALMRLRMRGIVAGVSCNPSELVQQLEAVEPEQVWEIAEKMKLRTIYFLHGGQQEGRRRT
jgi:predicted Zn-dependent peptidase